MVRRRHAACGRGEDGTAPNGTRAETKSRFWVFTINNYGESDERLVIELHASGDATYVVIGRETGASGTPHLQGYLEFATRKRFSAAKRLLGGRNVHIEPRRGSGLAAATYCKKDGDYKEYGTLSVSHQGRRDDLVEIRELIDAGTTDVELCRHYPGQWFRYYRGFREYRMLSRASSLRDVNVFVLWGDPGTGKSGYVYDFAKREYGDYSAVYAVSDSEHWWFDGYSGQPVVLFDDFRGESPVTKILRVTDRYPLLVPVKGGFTSFTATTIFFTSNKSPDEWFSDSVDARAFRRRLRKVVRCSDVGYGVGEWECYFRAITDLLGLQVRRGVEEEEKREE